MAKCPMNMRGVNQSADDRIHGTVLSKTETAAMIALQFGITNPGDPVGIDISNRFISPADEGHHWFYGGHRCV
jgi:hypothetical protein